MTSMKFRKTPVQSMIHNFVSSDYCYGLFKDSVTFDSKYVYFIALNSGALIERRIAVSEITDEVISSDFSVKFPYKVNPYFGVCNSETKELDIKKTREVFGLTCRELNEILPVVSLVLFNTGPLKNYMIRGLRVTSSYSENTCELTDAWIPSDFPYITETEGINIDHLSLYGFYKLISTICGQYSPFAASLIEGGVKEEILMRIRQMWVTGNIVRNPAVRPTAPSYYGDRV
jgi:hypothetical protein